MTYLYVGVPAWRDGTLPTGNPRSAPADDIQMSHVSHKMLECLTNTTSFALKGIGIDQISPRTKVTTAVRVYSGGSTK